MSGLDIDTRSDIYSLGVLLYELLTGTTPFDTKELMNSGLDEMRKIIREREPVRPSTRVSETLVAAEVTRLTPEEKEVRADSRRLLQIPTDLDWIVMKCLEKDRTAKIRDRQRAGHADLKRHLQQRTHRRPSAPSTAYRFQKAWRRNKLAFSAAAAVTLALVSGIGVSTWQTVVARKAQHEAEEARLSERDQRLETERQRKSAEESAFREREQRERMEALAYSTDMNLVLQALEMNNLGRAQELLNRNRPTEGSIDRRDWEWRYLWNQSRSDELTTLGSHDSYITTVKFWPQGELLVSGDMAGTIRFWNWKERLPAGEVKVGGHVQSLTFSPDGRHLAVRVNGAGTRILDVATRQKIVELPDSASGGVRGAVAFSPNGKLLAMNSVDGSVAIWDTSTFKPIGNIPRQGSPITAIQFSRDGRTIYFATDSKRPIVIAWDLEGEREIASFRGHTDWVTSLALSPDETQLVTSSGDGNIRVWDVENRREKAVLSNNAPLAWDASFSPDGLWLATCGADQRIRLWDTSTWQEVNLQKGHRGEVWSVAFSPDGSTLASAGKDFDVKLWRAQTKTQTPVRRLFPLGSWSVDGRWFKIFETTQVAIGSATDLSDRQALDLSALSVDSSNISVGLVANDGRRIYWGEYDGDMRSVDLTSGRELIPLVRHEGPVEQLALSPDGRMLASVAAGSHLRVQDVNTGQSIMFVSDSTIEPRALAFSPNGRSIAAATQWGELVVWDIQTGTQLLRLRAHRDLATNVAFSPDGRLMASGSWDGTAALWDAETGRRLATLRAHLLGVNAVTFSPDGNRLVAGTGDGFIKFWNVHDYQEVLTLKADRGVNYVGFPDGDETLVSATTTSIQLWHAPSLAQIPDAEPRSKTDLSAQ